ncbi:STAS domain-containing protein [Reichenbachiella versicolor]|uniref:STAS domain-containing protein n=1 Tax=Reichenbachiella versicolor TaxID=1821036 RepID=UPI000D6E3246|nr:STAS domain-containing protein [Reichenbachiella versicolor]
MVTIDTHSIADEGVYELSVHGEIDASSSIYLETALKEAMQQSKKILIDMSELEYISSAGLGVFMSILQDLENEEIQMVLFNMSEKVIDVFEILGLNLLMNIQPSKEEALAELK